MEWIRDDMKVRLFTRINAIENTYLSESLLYNTYRHITTGRYNAVYTYLLTVDSADGDFALIHFAPDGPGSWSSLPGAPFGGIQHSGRINGMRLHFLLHCVLNDLRKRGAHRLLIYLPPSFYQPHQAALFALALPGASFKIKCVEQYHAIPITGRAFEQLLAPAERRRLHKCKTAGMLGEVIVHDDISALYRQIATWRENAGHHLSMSEKGLSELFSACPSDILVFHLVLATKPVAIGILVKVNAHVLYHFVPAWDTSFKAFSPMVLLTETIYEYAQKHGFRWLDLGRSLDHQQKTKPSLARFKERLGAVEFPRTIWTTDV